MSYTPFRLKIVTNDREMRGECGDTQSLHFPGPALDLVIVMPP